MNFPSLFFKNQCACGCGAIVRKRFKHGHYARGKYGPNTPNWKGDDVKRCGLHLWVRSRLPKPELCQSCNTVPSYDLANITGKYNRDLTNWKYLCRQCHMLSDGRLNNNLVQNKSVIERSIAARNGWNTRRLRKGDAPAVITVGQK